MFHVYIELDKKIQKYPQKNKKQKYSPVLIYYNIFILERKKKKKKKPKNTQKK